MRIGVSAGPFWVSTSGRRRKTRWTAGTVLLLGWVMAAAFGVPVGILVWVVWIGVPVWLALVIVGAVARRWPKRPAVAASASATVPVSPRMYHSSRR